MWELIPQNIITMFRVTDTVFVVFIFFDWRWAHQAGAFIFWLAAITDWIVAT